MPVHSSVALLTGVPPATSPEGCEPAPAIPLLAVVKEVVEVQLVPLKSSVAAVADGGGEPPVARPAV